MQLINTGTEIGVTNGGEWGDWGPPVSCPEGMGAIGFALKVESKQGELGDDTALNSLKLVCSKSVCYNNQSTAAENDNSTVEIQPKNFQE